MTGKHESEYVNYRADSKTFPTRKYAGCDTNPIQVQGLDALTPHLPPADKAPRTLAEINRQAFLDRQAQWETWRTTWDKVAWDHKDHWRCGPDSPPGVGWKLTKQGQPDRFYKDRETAWERWTEKRDQWLADEPIPKKRKPA